MQDGDGISRHIWETRYRYGRGGRWVDANLDDTWWRVANALARPEHAKQDVWARRFHDDLLVGFTFLPGGRILAGAGTGRRSTLFNCFVMGVVPDSMYGIFKSLRESALTLQYGGGIGMDFSALRPAGWRAVDAGKTATGPVSFMRIWNEMAGTLQSLGQRRSAMMGTLRCDHPDILDFIAAKHAGGLENFNLAVQCTEEFLLAVERDAEWALVFPEDTGTPHASGTGGGLLERRWPGHAGMVACRVAKTLRARELWDALATAAAARGDPGVLFVDRINQENNLWYEEYITAANPCGELPLPAYGACNLGSFNLTALVQRPFAPDADFDLARLRRLVPLAVRMLDNAIDVSLFPLEAQAECVRRSRRIGIGVTGLADALIMLGLRYDSPAGCDFSARVFHTLRDEAYRASIELATERGHFPAYDPDYLTAPFIERLPDDISGAIAVHGIRNSHLIAQAPTGTISLLAGNVSSGIEPVFDYHVRRKIRGTGEYPLTDYAWHQWQVLYGDAPAPHAFVTASGVSPAAQLAMLGAIHPYVDNGISKTVALTALADGEAAATAFHQAYNLGLKSCTVFAWGNGRGVIEGTGERAVA